MSFSIDSIDHIVLNVADVEASAEWYVRVLGMQRIDFDSRTGVRVAVHFGAHKINLRPKDADTVHRRRASAGQCRSLLRDPGESGRGQGALGRARYRD
jgi:catechol 2,3-dioxygenase-like lactoylglutathione lyase family enzyme